ncbi:hypothetical protein [Moorena producens]|nr:hypothetical protein [Moorena producens]
MPIASLILLIACFLLPVAYSFPIPDSRFPIPDSRFPNLIIVYCYL